MDNDQLKSKKRKLSPELIAKKRELIKSVHEFNRGRKLTEEHKQHLKDNHVGSTGRKMSEYTKTRLKEGLEAKGYRKGFTLTDEQWIVIKKTNNFGWNNFNKKKNG